MLKEMQVLVAKERLAREELQNKIEHLEKSLTEKEAQSHGNRLNKSEAESKISSGGNLCKIYVKHIWVKHSEVHKKLLLRQKNCPGHLKPEGRVEL